jgi:DNA polymerase III subunit delta'
VFLLVAHRPGRLLATIRSRCRMLRFQVLDDDAMQSVLARTLPEISASERTRLVASVEGAPGRAIASRDLDLPALAQSLEVIVRGGRPAETERARLVTALSGVAARPRLEAFVDLVPRFIADRLREMRGPALGQGIEAYEEAQRLGAGAVTPLQLEPGALVYALCGVVAGSHGQRT